MDKIEVINRVQQRALEHDDHGAVTHVHVVRPVQRLELPSLEEEAHGVGVQLDAAAHDALELVELRAVAHSNLLDQAAFHGKLDEDVGQLPVSLLGAELLRGLLRQGKEHACAVRSLALASAGGVQARRLKS